MERAHGPQWRKWAKCRGLRIHMRGQEGGIRLACLAGRNLARNQQIREDSRKQRRRNAVQLAHALTAEPPEWKDRLL